MCLENASLRMQLQLVKPEAPEAQSSRGQPKETTTTATTTTPIAITTTTTTTEAVAAQ